MVTYSYTKCVYKVGNFGHDLLIDICNNTTTEVPWGILDYCIYAIASLSIGVLAYLLYKLISDVSDKK